MTRNRIGDAQSGGLSDEELQRAIAVATPLRLSVSEDALKEQVDEAIVSYSVQFELATATARARDRQRSRLQRAMGNLLKIARESETQALVELLQFYPATMQLLNRPLPERPGRLPLAALVQNLQDFSDALENRIFSDHASIQNDDKTRAFPALVGALWEAFDASFIETDDVRKEAKFDGFARSVLHGAGIRPVNGALFAVTAIKDALRTHRDFARKS